MKKIKTPPQTKPVKQQTGIKNYSKYSGSSYTNKHAFSVASTGENGNLKLAVELNQKYFIAIPKNDNARNEFQKWYDGFFLAKPKTETIETLSTLFNTNELFEVKEHSKETYKSYLEINANNWSELTGLPRAKYPPKPDKSFELLKDWYFEVLEIEKNIFLKTSFDNSPETLNTFEIELIEKLCNGIKKNYFPEKETIYDTHKWSYLQLTKVDFTANRTFLQWLGERKTALEENKVYSVDEEENKIDGIKNWNKKERTFLLKQIGLDTLQFFNELGQKKKYELIANILNCSPRKAMEYYNHSEKELSFEAKEEIKEYLKKIKEEKKGR